MAELITADIAIIGVVSGVFSASVTYYLREKKE